MLCWSNESSAPRPGLRERGARAREAVVVQPAEVDALLEVDLRAARRLQRTIPAMLRIDAVGALLFRHASSCEDSSRRSVLLGERLDLLARELYACRRRRGFPPTSSRVDRHAFTLPFRPQFALRARPPDEPCRRRAPGALCAASRGKSRASRANASAVPSRTGSMSTASMPFSTRCWDDSS